MKNSANATEPSGVSIWAAAGILAMTGLTEVVGLGAALVVVVVVVVAAEVAVLVEEWVEGVGPLGPGSPPVHAPSVATATSAAAYGRSVRCRCGVAAAVIGVPC